jgi:hypothetical protein
LQILLLEPSRFFVGRHAASRGALLPDGTRQAAAYVIN